MRTHHSSLPVLLGLAALVGGSALAGGCSRRVSEPDFGVVQAELVRAQSCDDLLGLLKADARARMNRYIDLQIAYMEEWEDDRFGGGFGDDGGEMGGPTLDAGGSTGSGGENAPPPEHSETNTQVEGVDEADIVKTDGYKLHVLHGPSFTSLTSWPVSELGIDYSFGIEGTPIEMFVDGGKAVVYSNVDGTPIYEALGLPLPDQGGGGYYGPEYDVGGYPGYSYAPLLKITVLDLSGAAPTVLSEAYEEGNYVSSRREGTNVRTVIGGGVYDSIVQYYPDIAYDGGDYPDSADEWIDAYESLRLQNELKIATATLDQFLPDRFVKVAGSFEQVAPSCGDAYVPTAGSTDFGLTAVHSIDLANLGAPAHESLIFGATQTVYASLDNLVLAGTSWGGGMGVWWGVGMPEAGTSVNATHLHVFDLSTNPSEPGYVGSATVPGYLTDQFAIDERESVLRVATTETTASSDFWETTNGVFTLAIRPDGVLPVGELRGLAPGETIYSTRFLGDRGYMVTFRQVDPLFVFDLSDPTAPTKLGELKIPGFSEYMHPLEDDLHLLTIGFDGTDDGQITGLALQIFDVTDPTDPKLSHKQVISEQWSGWSEALYNHKAFTLYRDVLAIPFEGYDDVNGVYGSALRLFRVSSSEGITELGSIDHSPYISDSASYCYYGRGVRRGVFIDDYVYSVSESAVVASAIEDVSTPVASVVLPSISTDYCNGYY